MNTNKKTKVKKWVTIGFIVYVIIVITVVYVKRPKSINYVNAVAGTGDITTYYSFSGNVDTKNRQTIMSDKMMQISDIYVHEGDIVKKDDVLIKSKTGDKIKSKINGVITNVGVKENAQVMAGNKLIEIVDNKNLKIKVKVDEYDLSALTEGKETRVTVNALDKEVTGKVKRISEEGQIANGVTFFNATIDLAKDNSIKIGMSAEVKLIKDQVTGVIILPMSAVLFDEYNNPYVLKKDSKGAAVKTKIMTGINDGTAVQIKSGVLNNETVLYTKAVVTQNRGFRGGASNDTDDGGND